MSYVQYPTEVVASASSPKSFSAADKLWPRRSIVIVMLFVLILAVYVLTFSRNMDDAYDTVRRMEHGSVAEMCEFRHFILRMLPLYLWWGLKTFHVPISAKTLLTGLDFVCATLSVLLLYFCLRRLAVSKNIALWTSFAYATCNCTWNYAGTGRLYSAAMLFVLSAYYSALELPYLKTERKRSMAAMCAGAGVCFACLFWMVHAFNVLGVGLFLLLAPEIAWKFRLKYATLFAATGLFLGIAIGVSTLTYIRVPLTTAGIQDWIHQKEVEPPPAHLNLQSPMAAAYGQAHGILAVPELQYMMNGFLRGDKRLEHMASFPWQLGKFVFTWALLTLVYLYPLLILRRSDQRIRMLILALYAPLLVNAVFALSWLGADLQRFMPTMFSQFGLAAVSVQDIFATYTRRRRPIALALAACVVFIAADNLAQSIYPAHIRFGQLAEEFRGLQPVLRSNDIVLTFGRDIPVTYHTMLRYYTGAQYIYLTNDVEHWNWDTPNWQMQYRELFARVWTDHGRVFLIDRLVKGENPSRAGWTERQHPNPSVREISQFLAAQYCESSAFAIEGSRFYEIVPRDACKSVR